MDALGPIFLLAIICLIDGLLIGTIVTWFVSHRIYMRKSAALHQSRK